VIVDFRDPRRSSATQDFPGVLCTRGMLESGSIRRAYAKAIFRATRVHFHLRRRDAFGVAAKTAQDMGLSRSRHMGGRFAVARPRRPGGEIRAEEPRVEQVVARGLDRVPILQEDGLPESSRQ